MSLQPQAQYTVPIETANVARAVFPQGNLCITMSERLSEFIDDEMFSHLFKAKGQTAGEALCESKGSGTVLKAGGSP